MILEGILCLIFMIIGFYLPLIFSKVRDYREKEKQKSDWGEIVYWLTLLLSYFGILKLYEYLPAVLPFLVFGLIVDMLNEKS